MATTLPANGLDYDPKQTALIVNTILYLKNNARFFNTWNSANKTLKLMSKNVNLADPDAVKTYIANAKKTDGKTDLSRSTKQKYAYHYDTLCRANGLKWTKPIYWTKPKAPLIPTRDQVTKIISCATTRYCTIFTILAETGFEGEELHCTPQKQIDTVDGRISIDGHKGHESGTYKLKPATNEMLKAYLIKNPQEYPFPTPKVMGQVWVDTRRRASKKYCQPELCKIPLKSLRNYSGAQLYNSLPVRDPVAVMRHLRHTKIDTTMHYIRAIVLDYSDEEWISLVTKSVDEECKAIEKGYQLVRQINETTCLYRKRKGT